MADYILLQGDQAQFQANFGLAMVVVRPGFLVASGPTTLTGKRLCVEGDEKNLRVPACMYTTAVHTIPGAGTLGISALGSDQTAKKTRSGKKAVLLKGGIFTAKFEVTTPAQQPPPGPGSPIPDSTPSYIGQGSFTTSNSKFQGS